jgi:hypothetical protein
MLGKTITMLARHNRVQLGDVTRAGVFPGIFAPGKAQLPRPGNNPRIGTTNVHTVVI